MYKRALRLQLLATSPGLLRRSYRLLLQEFQCFCRLLPPLLLREASGELPEADLYIALDHGVLAWLPPLKQPVRVWSDIPMPEGEQQVWLSAKFQGIIGGLRLLHRLKNEENQ